MASTKKKKKMRKTNQNQKINIDLYTTKLDLISMQVPEQTKFVFTNFGPMAVSFKGRSGYGRESWWL